MELDVMFFFLKQKSSMPFQENKMLSFLICSGPRKKQKIGVFENYKRIIFDLALRVY